MNQRAKYTRGQPEQFKLIVERRIVNGHDRGKEACLYLLPDDEEHWIPHSQTHSTHLDDDPPYIMVTPFIAKKLGEY